MLLPSVATGHVRPFNAERDEAADPDQRRTPEQREQLVQSEQPEQPKQAEQLRQPEHVAPEAGDHAAHLGFIEPDRDPLHVEREPGHLGHGPQQEQPLDCGKTHRDDKRDSQHQE